MHEFEQTLEDSGQGKLACWQPMGLQRVGRDPETELNNNKVPGDRKKSLLFIAWGSYPMALAKDQRKSCLEVENIDNFHTKKIILDNVDTFK